MPARPVRDKELIEQAKQGDPHAFGDLYEEHAPAVYRYLCTHLENLMDAEDLTAEVFLKAWRSLPNYHERGVPFLVFLFRIAHNTLVDDYRHNHHFEATPADEMDCFESYGQAEPAEVSGQKSEHQQIVGVLSRLKPDYQSVLTLRFINELSPAETANAMNRSVGAVRVLQHRALAALREMLEEADKHEK